MRSRVAVLLAASLSGCLTIPEGSQDNPCDPAYEGSATCQGIVPADAGADADPSDVLPNQDATPLDAAMDAAPVDATPPPDMAPDAPPPPDGDDDGVPDPDDNCPTTANPDQVDRDDDGEGDACDLCPRGGDAVDADGDRHLACDDCDDTRAEVHPGAAEVCNGLDDDCDRARDEGDVCVGCAVEANVGGSGLTVEVCDVAPPGADLTFWMGCREGVEGEQCVARELPQHPVTVTAPFRLTRREITVAEYRACVEAGHAGCDAADTCDFEGRPNYGGVGVAGHPIVCVSQPMARAFCQWIGGDLPTESEWELAARGPMTAPEAYQIYPWGDAAPECRRARYSTCGSALVASGFLGVAGASPFGLYDMAGNAAEWVADCSHPSYEGAPADTTAWLSDCAGAGGVARGGSYIDAAENLRSAYRRLVQPSARLQYVGFRCRLPGE